jgi:hypothetical protein
LGKDLIERAVFRDAYRAPTLRQDLVVVEVFFVIFAHSLDESAVGRTQQDRGPR